MTRSAGRSWRRIGRWAIVLMLVPGLGLMAIPGGAERPDAGSGGDIEPRRLTPAAGVDSAGETTADLAPGLPAWRRHLDAARAYRERAQLVLAIGAGEAAVAALEGSPSRNPLLVALALEDLALTLVLADRPTEAEVAYARAASLEEILEGPAAADLGITLGNLGRVQYLLGHYDEAESSFRRAVAILDRHRGPRDPDAARALNGLALVETARGRYGDAERHLTRALVVLEEALGPEHPDALSALQNLACVLEVVGAWPAAERLAREALDRRVAVLGPDHPDLAQSHYYLGTLFEVQGRFFEAERECRRALVLLRRGEQLPLAAAPPLATLAGLLRARGDLDEAESACRRALEIVEGTLGTQHPEAAATRHALARIVADRRPAEAEGLYREAVAVEVRTLGESHPLVARTLNGLAALMADAGRPAEAEAHYRRALAIACAGLPPRHPDLAALTINLASCRLALGDSDEAARLLENALDRLAVGPERWDGSAARLRALPATVTALHLRSAIAAGETAPPPQAALDDARRWGGAALEVLQRMRGAMARESREAMDRENRGLPGWLLEIEARRARLGLPADSDRCLRVADIAVAASFLEQAAAVEAEVRGALPRALADEEARARARLERARAAAGDPASDLELVAAEGAFETFVRHLRAAHPAAAAWRYPTPAGWTEVSAALEEDEVLVAWTFSAEGGWVQAVTRETHAIARLGDRAAIESLAVNVATAQSTMGAGGTTVSPATAIGARLRRLLFQPVESLMANRRIHLLVPPELEAVSFAALPGETATWWGDERSLRQVASLAVFARSRPRSRTPSPRPPRLLAVGDPVYDLAVATTATRDRAASYSSRTRDGWTRLPGSGAEVRAIARLFPEESRRLLVGERATEQGVAAEDWGRFDYIHFACHGALESGEGRVPALVLGLGGNSVPFDGFLTIPEVASRPQSARLVVLSACNTGRSATRASRTGVSSLARAFLLGGSRAVVVSLWPVDDLATATLMVLLYEAAVGRGLPAPEALDEARRSVRESHRARGWNHPAYWAGFICLGE